MSELEEIMKGKIKLKHFNIDNDTISFQTELDNYTWNLTPRDIEIIIYNLQERIDKAIEYINNSGNMSLVNGYSFPEKPIIDKQVKQELLSILEGDDKE